MNDLSNLLTCFTLQKSFQNETRTMQQPFFIINLSLRRMQKLGFNS